MPVHDVDHDVQRALLHPLVGQLQTRLASRTPGDAHVRPESRLAAVMALLRVTGTHDDAVELLFIKRASVVGDPWSGHIAFPGGRHDASDATLADTAIRETHEELGIDLRLAGRVIGRLDDIAPQSPVLPPIIVRPFIGIVARDTPIVPNREVAAAFWVPVRLLQSDASRSEHVLERNGETARFPAYHVQSGAGPALVSHVVWGMTERIVVQLLPLFGAAAG